MKLKIRWYKIEPFDQSLLKKVLAHIRKHAFSETKAVGFILDEHSPTRLDARFVERTEITRRIISPLGALSEFTAVSFCETSFSLRSEWPSLEVTGGFKNVGKFLNHLAMALDFSVTIEEERFSIERFLAKLTPSVTNLKIDAVTIRNLQIDSSTAAYLEINSSGNAFEKATKLVGNRKCEIHKIRCEWSHTALICALFLSSDGHLSTNIDPDSETWPVLLGALKNSRL